MPKRKIFLTVQLALLCLLNISPVKADTNETKDTSYINNNGIVINSDTYNNLLNLGFTEFEIANMAQEEYNANKDLIGEVVSTTEKYYKTVTAYSPITKEAILSRNYEIDEDEYNAASVQTRGDGYVETNYKKMTTQITWVMVRYRYKITLEWKTMPSKRSYDIIGVGLDPSEVYIAGGGVYFQQDYCYSSGSCTYSNRSMLKSTSVGGAAVFELPSGSLSTLTSYLYYMVDKDNPSVPLTTMHAYGDYSHATSTTSYDVVSHYAINSTGLALDYTIIGKYDAMNGATATWSGSW